MLVLCLSFVVALLDQIGKHLVRASLSPFEPGIQVIPGLFAIAYVRNTGAAWGILRGLNNWLVLLSFVMLGVIAAMRRHFFTESLMHRIAGGLIIGGIVGNLIDRLRLGYVVDFLDFYLGPRHFPAFNLADSAICVGVGLYALHQALIWRNVLPRDSANT